MPSTPEGRRAIALARVAVLASSVALMLPGAWGHSVTVVEFAQLPAGMAAWQRGSLGIYRVCGPASKFLYALPAHLAGARVDYPPSFDSDVRWRWEWELGRIFQEQHTERYHDIYRCSRLIPILLTLLSGCLVCEWSTRLFGAWPGLVSLCAWCWLPPALAHGSLVTSDMPAALAALITARCLWAFVLAPRSVTALLVGLSLGLAAATKFTLLVFYPLGAVLLIGRAIHVRQSAPSTSRVSLARLIGLGLLTVSISLLVLNGFYLFQDVGLRLEEWDTGKSTLAHDVIRLREWLGTAWLLQVPLPIPREFLLGLDVQLADTERLQEAYLLGRTRLGGWWYWYAAAALIKLPLPALAFFTLAFVRLPRAVRGRDPVAWAAICTLLPATEIALAIASSTGTGTNAAFRYLLPSLILCCVWVGSVGEAKAKFVRFLATGLLAWLALDAAAGLPDHLGWQNEIGRLCSRDRPALLGDSLDWGQDLARLGRWVDRHAREGRTQVCVYGLGDAEPYGLRPSTTLPGSVQWRDATFLAVSADILFGYEAQQCVSVVGSHSQVDQEQREKILDLMPFDRVGRTIWIYRIR